MEEYDATYDSDEDADFTKMDMVCTIHVCGCKRCFIHMYIAVNSEHQQSHDSHVTYLLIILSCLLQQGNKKGPVKRWDFENEDEYSSYQSRREALPKSVFTPEAALL